MLCLTGFGRFKINNYCRQTTPELFTLAQVLNILINHTQENRMTYQETIDFLFSSLPMYQRSGKAAYKANLDNTIALDKALGHPHKAFSSIHIAGTNGKGSVSHMLASIFREAGYKTGLYTSPHLLDFRERIRIDGEMIAEEQVTAFVERIRRLIEAMRPSFFEMTVAMAFDHFAREQVDIAIIETGMGGRLDSTNIITPVLSLITSISMDHAEFLGDTPELIAREKGGIIKPGIPVVAGRNSTSVNAVFSRMAETQNSQLLFADHARTFRYHTTTPDNLSLFHFTNHQNNAPETVLTDLQGTYQHENISLVLTAIERLNGMQLQLTSEAVGRGFARVKKNTALRGRWEILGANPRIIADTAHNAGGILPVMEQLRQVPAKRLHIVWGMVGDKATEEIFRLLPPEARYYFTSPSIPRAMPVNDLLQQATAAGLHGSAFHTVEEAFEAARTAAQPEDTIFVGGSTYVIADLLKVTG